ncbi:CU044_2847 family protein [Roseateles sp. L2-2]|uniref:CU044_2847 family protein n=1 Tax=Roseateles sp. L2-2 TaxID=3422597 RepID=UPI003D35FA80
MTKKSAPPLQIEVVHSLSPEAFPDDDLLSRGVPPRVWEVVDISKLGDNLSRAITQLAEKFKPSEDGPKLCEITFSLKASAEGSLIVSKAAAEANFQVKVVWERKP